MCFDVKNECIRKKFQKCNMMYMRDFLNQKHKRNLFFRDFSLMLIFKNTSNANLFEFF